MGIREKLIRNIGKEHVIFPVCIRIAINGVAVILRLVTPAPQVLPISYFDLRRNNQCLINDEITLRNYGGEMHVYFYEKEYLEAFETRTLKVPDTVSFMDGVDPETGDPLDEEAKRTADEFRALLAGGKEMDPGFDADNVYVSFDDNEEMVLVQRFYAPWQ